MVEVKILKADEPSPKAEGEYVQVITRKEQEGNPGNIVSDIEHFTLGDQGAVERMSRETRDIGFKEAIDLARDYAQSHDVPIVYARDRSAEDIGRN